MNSNQAGPNHGQVMIKQDEDVKDTFARRVDGTREGATFYVMDGLLFRKKSTTVSSLKVNCIGGFYSHKKTSNDPPRCGRRASLDHGTLRITKVVGEHSCNQDPELATQLCMETEMKQLAAMSKDDFRDIFDKVGRKNPVIAARIPFDRICAAMKTRRFIATPCQF